MKSSKQLLGLGLGLVALSPSAFAVDWQSRLESRFMPLGTIINRSPTSSRISGMDDSALWSGVYLASQCFRGADAQAGKILDGIETLFEATGASGAMARFAFRPSEAQRKGITGLDFNPNDSKKRDEGWRESKAKPGWVFLGKTSRDQYTGFFFGAQVCLEYSRNTRLVGRLRTLVTDSVRALMKNGWKIPNPAGFDYGHQTMQNVDFDMKLAWALIGKKWTLDASLNAGLNSAIQDGAEKVAARSQITKVEIPGTGIKFDSALVNNYVEYYAWNLRYLVLYGIFRTASKSSLEYAAAREYFNRAVWPYTWDHQNTEFTLIKKATLGLKGNDPRDQRALIDARRSLNALMNRSDRTNRHVDLSSRIGRDFKRDPLAQQLEPLKYLGDLIGDLSWLKRINGQMADRPLPVSLRPGVDYFWQHNPYYYTGGKSPADEEYPAVDLLLVQSMSQAFSLQK